MSLVIIGLLLFAQRIFPEIRQRMTFNDVVMLVFGSVCQQPGGTLLEISKVSGRIVIMTTYVLTLFIFIAYSANILVLLQIPSHAINSVDDLISSPVKLAVQDTGYNRYYFEKEKAGVVKKIYEKKIKPEGNDGWMYEVTIGVEKVRTQLYAFQVEIAAAYKFISQTFTDDEKCSLAEISVLKIPKLTGSVARNSPYREIFRQR